VKSVVKKTMLSERGGERLGNLDVFRAVAALAVCFHHFNRESLTGGTWFSEIAKYGNYGVDIFFVISGYVIPLALLRRNFHLSQMGNFLHGRFLRLYPAYALAATLTLLLWYASTWIPGFRGEGPPVISIVEILANATLTCDFFHQPWFGIVFWTLAIEAQYYVFVVLSFPLLFCNSGRNQLPRWVLLGAWLLLPLLFRQGPTVFGWSALFAMGFLAILWQRGELKSWVLCIGLAIAGGGQWEVRGPVSAVLGLSTALGILFLPNLAWRPLVWVGTISYSLYLLHVPIGGRVMNFLERFAEFAFVQHLSVPLALAVSLFAAWLFFLVVEKPSHDLAQNTLQKPKQRHLKNAII
jgi:peptidoglycan/LPS O-acetylase OafA/YrhL